MKKFLGIILSGLLILTMATSALAKHKKEDNKSPLTSQSQAHKIRKATLFGKIISLDMSNNSFVIQASKLGQLTVSVSGDTKLVNRREQTINFSDLAIGHRVRVKGRVDLKEHKFIEVRQVKDFNLPY